MGIFDLFEDALDAAVSLPGKVLEAGAEAVTPLPEIPIKAAEGIVKGVEKGWKNWGRRSMENSTPTPAPLPLDAATCEHTETFVGFGIDVCDWRKAYIRCKCGLSGKAWCYHVDDASGKVNAEAAAREWWNAFAARRAGSTLPPVDFTKDEHIVFDAVSRYGYSCAEAEALVARIRSGSASASPGPAGREEGDPILEAVKTMEHAAPSAHAMLRNNGIVFGGEGGQWEKTAFTLYTDLVELTEIARHALAAQPAAAPAAEQGNTSPTLNTEIKP